MGSVGLKRMVAQSDYFYTALYEWCMSASTIGTGIRPDLSGDKIKSTFFEGLREKGCNG